MGDLKYRIVTLTGDSSYPSGGYALTKANLALNTVLHSDSSESTAGYLATWNPSTEKVMFFRDAGAAGAFAQPTGVNVTTVSVTLFFLGK